MSSLDFEELVENIFSRISHSLISRELTNYSQLESFIWLKCKLNLSERLPPLRGWAASPDVLLKLHTHIMSSRPSIVVECGSGASTLVIADALSQNGHGKLISLEHSDFYGGQTLETLKAESLEGWVDLRIAELEPWSGPHLNPDDAEKPAYWYCSSLLDDVTNVDLLWVDGPPGSTCLFSRYPAFAALEGKFSSNAEIWMDDTNRKDDRKVCEAWAHDSGFEVEFLPMEKGLGRLTRPASTNGLTSLQTKMEPEHPERAYGFDFSISDDDHIG